MSKRSVTAHTQSFIFVLLLAGLLILRFPLLLLLPQLSLTKEVGMEIFQTGSYLLISLLILLERGSLSDYHIDRLALALLLLAPTAKIISCTVFQFQIELGAWLNVVISVCLLAALLLLRPKLHQTVAPGGLLWVLIAVAVGIGMGIGVGFFLKLQSPEYQTFPFRLPLAVRGFFIQLANAAALEEPLFRGFLWGFLKKLRWKEFWIWLFQALLFVLGHLYYLGVSNYSFFLIVPMCALVLGLLAWRSRSIGTSMITHGLINSLGDLVAHLF